MAKHEKIDEAIKSNLVKMEKAMEEILLMVEADAKMIAPVKTGTLRRSITHEQQTEGDKVYGAVGSNVEYAYWAELKRPYLEPAVDMNIENMRRKIAEVMKNEGN
jgi:hypothetical protein